MSKEYNIRTGKQAEEASNMNQIETDNLLCFLSLSREIVWTVMPVKEIMCAKRSTQLGDTKICNTHSHWRNLDIQNQWMLFSSLYTKTSNLTGQDSFLHTQVAKIVSQPLMHNLAVVRPIEVISSCVVWGDGCHCCHLIPTHLFYLYVT